MLVSSHVLAEVAQTVDQVLIINRGRLVVESSLGAADRARRRRGARPLARSWTALREALASEGIEATERPSGVLLVHGATSERVGDVAAAAGIVLSRAA